ncbi:MAG: DUF1461 domain-containing protein, partial [Hyphomicrobiales bacterium]
GVIIRAIGAVALIAAAITGAVLLLFTPTVFSILGYHPIAVEYVLGDIDPAVLLVFRAEGKAFTPREISHLADVKMTIGLVRWGFAATLALLVLLAFFSGKAFRAICLWAPGVFLGIGATVILAYFTLGFQLVGSVFHRVFFPQGNWAFPFNSLIITLYGTEEMVNGTVFVLSTALLFLLIIAVVVWRANRALPTGPEIP